MATDFISNNGVAACWSVDWCRIERRRARSPSPTAMRWAISSPRRGGSFGSGLPNTFVSALAYNPSVDALAVSLWGRGIWMMYDVTSYFSTRRCCSSAWPTTIRHPTRCSSTARAPWSSMAPAR
jgi:hypothetical protein